MQLSVWFTWAAFFTVVVWPGYMPLPQFFTVVLCFRHSHMCNDCTISHRALDLALKCISLITRLEQWFLKSLGTSPCFFSLSYCICQFFFSYLLCLKFCLSKFLFACTKCNSNHKYNAFILFYSVPALKVCSNMCCSLRIT